LCITCGFQGKSAAVKIWKAGLIGLAVLLLALLAADLRLGGTFTGVPDATGQTCGAVDLAGNAAALQLDPERGIVYLALLDRAKPGSAGGTVQLLDLNLAQPAPRAAMNFDPGSFRPAGLSLLKAAGEPRRIFAISTLPDGEQTVEISAETASGGFSPETTVRDPAFRHLSAIAAIGPRAFYVVSVSNARDELALPARSDALLRRAPATLLYYDGREAHVILSDLRHAGGLARSPDGKLLYVAETLAQSLRIYEPRSNGAVLLRGTIPLGVSPGRLTVDADGVVWIAAYPKLHALRAHAKDPSLRVPTQVLRFDPRLAFGEVASVYANDGQALSAGTVAARWRDKLVIGALLDHKVLICQLNP
jgi:arylesterase/paraoxonase